jgi:hypothetical protein
MTQADLVAMDLRSFGPANAGCVFELQALLDLVPLGRLVLLVDRTTDRPFLERTLRERWQELAVGSPNATDPAPRLLLLDAGDVPAAVRRLEGLAAPAMPGAVAVTLQEPALA